MATIAVNPILLKDTIFAVAADRYEAAVSTVEFVPSSSIVSWKGLTPSAVFTGVTSSTWTVNLTYAQDWSTTNSLSQYLFNNEGKSVVVKFIPQTAAVSTTTVPTFTATVFIVPGSVGGAIDGFASASVTLAVVGKPTITTAVAPA
jgi:hypothetical protein